MNALEKTIQAFKERKPYRGAICKTPRTNREGLNGFDERITSTDGRVFYSYAMPIAVHSEGRVFILLRECATSKTTKKHVDALTREFKPRSDAQVSIYHLEARMK